MDEQLKQRLVGAAVVISLGIIFLPMILDGGRHTAYEKVDLTIPPAPDVDYESSVEPLTPVQVVSKSVKSPEPPQIDKQPHLIEKKLEEDVPDLKAEVADLIEPIEPADKVVSKQGEDLTKKVSSVPDKPEIKQTTTPEKVVSKPKTITKPVVKASKPAVKKPVASSSPVSAWVIQVGSFSSRERALELRNKLRKNGFVSFVESFSGTGKTAHRVRIGPETGRERAEASLKKLKSKLGIKGIIVSYP